MPTPLDPDQLTFRPLALDELPMVKAWCDEPHAAPWFKGGRPLEDVVAEFLPSFRGEEPISSFVVSYAGAPIGLCQWERLADFPETFRAYGATDPGTVNIDVLIGDPTFARRGLGAPLVLRFLRDVVFQSDAGATVCLIDPRVENAVAIRAYEKAGFCYVRTVADPEDGERLHLMELTRAQLDAAFR